MKRILLALGLCLASSCGEAPAEVGEVASGRPPAVYRGDGAALVIMTKNVAEQCRKAGLKQIAGAEVEACSVIGGEQPIIIIRNPCLESGKPSSKLCHELGHVNGWPMEHGS